MIVGVPKEIKNNENRVGMTPAGVNALVRDGHKVLVEKSAGVGSGFSDESYTAVGASIINSAAELYKASEMIVKVKELLPSEFSLVQEGQILFTYLHLAAEPGLAAALLEKKAVGIAYETVQLPNRSLPLLAPMSEVAGRMAVQVGAQYLCKQYGGKGILLPGVAGVLPGKVTIVGGGVSGTNAAMVAAGMGADVTILELNPERLRALDNLFQFRVKTLMANHYNIVNAVKEADLLIGAVLLPGTKAPRIITEEMVKEMSQGSVIVDLAIDQGSCVETIDHATNFDDPVFVKHGVVHYCVANMPGAVARTSTLALTNATLPYALEIANMGHKNALLKDQALFKGTNVYQGKVTYQGVAESLGLEYTSLSGLLS